MEGEADRDELRFRLNWPEEHVGSGDDELTDFSFEWDEQSVDVALAATGEPQLIDPVDPMIGGRDTAFLDPTEALDVVRRALDDNNDALRQLSEAVYELASNVRLLVDEVETLGRGGGAVVADSHAGDVTASAMVTMSAEVTAAIERLSDELHGTRGELQGMMDDVVAAAGGEGVAGGGAPRVTVELDRVHSELQALKRRLPVRARELDAADIADRVAEAVIAVLGGSFEPEAPRPARRAVKAPPPASAERTDRRRRPLRAD